MEGRMTVCNLSIEMGARGGMIAPDEKTFKYIKGKEYAPKEEEWDKAISYWSKLKTDKGAVFDKEYNFKGEEIEPMITYGTNPGMAIPISKSIPTSKKSDSKASYLKALDYMDFKEGDQRIGKKIDYVFLGSCTNGRIEDFRTFASIIKGKRKSDNIDAWLVPGSHKVLKSIKDEGILDILTDSGFKLREPGCSACLAMNDDKIPKGKYAVSTTNRNFEGRQGPGARTLLASPLVAAATAITGKITDPREII
jgi:3-isopropylmalate/(R)-2-methylmalate dehydratase large subunit